MVADREDHVTQLYAGPVRRSTGMNLVDEHTQRPPHAEGLRDLGRHRLSPRAASQGLISGNAARDAHE